MNSFKPISVSILPEQFEKLCGLVRTLEAADVPKASASLVFRALLDGTDAENVLELVARTNPPRRAKRAYEPRVPEPLTRERYLQQLDAALERARKGAA